MRYWIAMVVHFGLAVFLAHIITVGVTGPAHGINMAISMAGIWVITAPAALVIAYACEDPARSKPVEARERSGKAAAPQR